MTMTTWASVAGKEAPQAAPAPEGHTTDQPSTAVIDANAIISELRLERIAEQAVTIAEVLKEARTSGLGNSWTAFPSPSKSLSRQMSPCEQVKHLFFSRFISWLHAV